MCLVGTLYHPLCFFNNKMTHPALKCVCIHVWQKLRNNLSHGEGVLATSPFIPYAKVILCVSQGFLGNTSHPYSLHFSPSLGLSKTMYFGLQCSLFLRSSLKCVSLSPPSILQLLRREELHLQTNHEQIINSKQIINNSSITTCLEQRCEG